MLFSQDEPLKATANCSGGEKMRLMFSKLMLEKPNTLLMDDPTNHLDLESISALNDSLVNYPGTIIIKTHDVEMIETIVTRTIEL